MVNQLTNSISVFKMTGEDVTTFINNQIVSDLSAEHNKIYTVICNPKGRIIFSLFIKTQNEETLIAVDSSLGDNFLHFVKMRLFRMKATITQTDKQFYLNRPKTGDSKVAFEFIDNNTNNHQGPITYSEFWQRMFSAGLPWINADNSECHIPQHLNLDQKGVINFEKGCYPGQEIIARLHFLGKVKKRLQLITYHNEHPFKNNETVALEQFSSKVELCSPSFKVGESWQAQAVVNN